MITAYVREEFAQQAVDIFIVLRGDDSTKLLRLGDDHHFDRWEPVDPAQHHDEPTLRLPEEVARPLLDALTTHYAGASDTRQLRADYDAERARVDRLIGALITKGT